MENEIPFRRFGTMLDCSRNAVMNIPTLKKWIDLTADLGYNTLLLYTEETYEVDNNPYFGHMRGRYSQQELREIDDYAYSKGMELIPCIQTLAHMNALFKWEKYKWYEDCSSIFLVGDERVYTLIDEMFASIKKSYRSNVVNIGMDEAWELGRGNYMDKHGPVEDKSALLLSHLQRVSDIARKYDLELIMWGDMFFRFCSGGSYENGQANDPQGVSDKIPDNVRLIYWDYTHGEKEHYDKQIRSHAALKEDVWFAGGLWTWTGFAPDNSYSTFVTMPALESCRANGVQDVFLTMWGDDAAECSKFSSLPSLYVSAEYAKGHTDMEQIKAGFQQKFGIAFDDFMLLDLPNTPNELYGQRRDPEKYMLYSDCFMGKFDYTVRPGDGDTYAACAEKMKPLEKDPNYGYLFTNLRALCDCLAVKFDLGIRTREAYAAGDREKMKDVIRDYDRLIERLDVFFAAFSRQWMLENKPHGFDVQDIRLGGLMCRVKHCRARLQEYAEGTLAEIPELDEPMLDYYGGGEAKETGPVFCNCWYRTVTANNM